LLSQETDGKGNFYFFYPSTSPSLHQDDLHPKQTQKRCLTKGKDRKLEKIFFSPIKLVSSRLELDVLENPETPERDENKITFRP
jgi:hypothetical protein